MAKDTGKAALQPVVMKYLVASLAGIVFGFCAEKARVFEPSSIRYQMIFRKFIMLKMFLAAVFSGAVWILLLAASSWTKPRVVVAQREYINAVGNKGVLAVVSGTFLLGIGMTLSGACPGMVLAQVGAGTQHALITFAGGICGAFLYGLLEPYIRDVFDRKLAIDKKKMSLPDWLGVSMPVIATPLIVCMGTLVIVIEQYIPWSSDLSVSNDDTQGLLQLRAWSPILAGLIIGTLQVPIILVLGDTLGGSSTYCTIAALPLCTKSLSQQLPYLARKRCGIDNWWQVVYVVSAILGAYFSSTLSSTNGSTPGVSASYAFSGGLLMIFGARLAAGCTSGHGLSGCALMVPISFLGVVSMFAGAIATATILLDWGELETYYFVF